MTLAGSAESLRKPCATPGGTDDRASGADHLRTKLTVDQHVEGDLTGHDDEVLGVAVVDVRHGAHRPGRQVELHYGQLSAGVLAAKPDQELARPDAAAAPAARRG